MKKKTANELMGRVIDVHSHVGVALKGFAKGEYPYAETIESVYYKQLVGGVDMNVVFPFRPDLYCDLKRLIGTGDFVPDENPISPIPYELENRNLFREVYEQCPELSDRFLPFLCVDPGRCQREQLALMDEILRKYPVYGIKIVPILCQSRAIELLKCPDFFAFAEKHDLPILFHATSNPNEKYSYVGDLFSIIDAYPKLRYCLAHCLGFHEGFMEKADSRENVWVDNSAMKIQVDSFLDRQNQRRVDNRFPADYSDHRKVFRALVEKFPNTMIWGTDAPAYAYMVDRKTFDGSIVKFRLKGTYEDEIAALNYLSKTQKMKTANTNTLAFLFGN